MSLPFALGDVRKIAFYKRDEITTDLIFCDVEVEDENGTRTWFNHEESDSWTVWIDQLSTLPGFDTDWYRKAYQPTFALSPTIAYEHAR